MTSLLTGQALPFFLFSCPVTNKARSALWQGGLYFFAQPKQKASTQKQVREYLLFVWAGEPVDKPVDKYDFHVRESPLYY